VYNDGADDKLAGWGLLITNYLILLEKLMLDFFSNNLYDDDTKDEDVLD
jgi:hypothetical protein